MSQRKIEEWALPYVKKFRTYIDIGASTGKTSVPYISLFQQIYAFEPNPNSFKVLNENKEITSFNVALGNKEETLNLIVPSSTKNNEHGSIAIIRNSDWEGETFSVPVNILDNYHFEDVDFIKIDVEQFELQVVQGSLDTINKHKPVIMFENKRNENDSVIEVLKNIGYKINKHKSDTVAYYE